MIAAISLGSFIVNLGQLSRIPCGTGRMFRVGGRSIAVFHMQNSNVRAVDATGSTNGIVFDSATNGLFDTHESERKTYPALVNEGGDILVGIEELLAAR